MKFEGTKGEWQTYQHLAEVQVGTPMVNICTMHYEDNKEIDARLISAAPELLDAVLITLKWIKTGQETETAVRNRCEKALKKALAKKDADLEEWFIQLP